MSDAHPTTGECLCAWERECVSVCVCVWERKSAWPCSRCYSRFHSHSPLALALAFACASHLCLLVSVSFPRSVARPLSPLPASFLSPHVHTYTWNTRVRDTHENAMGGRANTNIKQTLTRTQHTHTCTHTQTHTHNTTHNAQHMTHSTHTHTHNAHTHRSNRDTWKCHVWSSTTSDFSDCSQSTSVYVCVCI